MPWRRSLILICPFLLGITCFAEDYQALQQAAKLEFQGKTLMLRGFPTETHLEFDSNCRPTHKFKTGSWTLSDIDIQKVAMHRDDLILSGVRVGFARLDNSGFLVKTRLGKENSSIKITIKGPFPSSPEEVIKSMQSIFVLDSKELANLAPPAWHAYLNGEIIKVVKDKKTTFRLKEFDLPEDDEATGKPQIPLIGHLPDGQPLYRVLPKSMTAPKPISSKDPEYNEVARAARFQGKTVLSVIILSTGDIGSIAIVDPVGLGLDDQAVAAVKKWKFKPAVKDGTPVPVLINVEVSFNLY